MPRVRTTLLSVVLLCVTALMVPGVAAHVQRAATGVDTAAVLTREYPDAGGYAFLQHQSREPARPVTYDPCSPIRIQVDTDEMQEAGKALSLILGAMREVSAATGLHLQFVGPSHEAADAPRVSPGRGMTPAPALITFATSAEVPRLRGDVTGVGGSTSVQRHGRRFYVTGRITLDAATFRRLLAEPAFVDRARTIVLHELGHLVGLAHVADPDALMNATDTGLSDFGPGDLRGLGRLGAGDCA